MGTAMPFHRMRGDAYLLLKMRFWGIDGNEEVLLVKNAYLHGRLLGGAVKRVPGVGCCITLLKQGGNM